MGRPRGQHPPPPPSCRRSLGQAASFSSSSSGQSVLLQAAPGSTQSRPTHPLLSYIPESPGQPPCYLWKLTAHPLLLNHRWVWFSSDSVSSDQSRHLWDKQTRQQYLLSTYCMPARSQAEKQGSDYDQEASPPEGTRCSLLKHTGSEWAAKLPSHPTPTFHLVFLAEFPLQPFQFPLVAPLHLSPPFPFPAPAQLSLP